VLGLLALPFFKTSIILVIIFERPLLRKLDSRFVSETAARFSKKQTLVANGIR
jgi:hypothetical protein